MGFLFGFVENRFRDLIQIGPFDPEIREFGQRLIRVERLIDFRLIRQTGERLIGRLGIDRPDGRTHSQDNQHAEAATISDQTHYRLFSG